MQILLIRTGACRTCRLVPYSASVLTKLFRVSPMSSLVSTYAPLELAVPHVAATRTRCDAIFPLSRHCIVR